MGGIDARNKNILDKKFICPACSLILSDPVQLNTCGHRLCQSCFLSINQTVIKCAQCQKETSRDQVMLDRGFKNDVQSLRIVCSLCNWTDILQNYQEHLTQIHSNPKCEYCDQQFNSVNQLNQHKTSLCQKITVECLLKDFGCHQQIVRSELLDHYKSKQHQDSMLNVIDQMKSQLTHGQITTTSINDNFAVNQLDELHETMNVLASGARALNEDAQRLDIELLEHQVKLQRLIQNVTNVKIGVEEENVSLEQATRNLNIQHRDLTSLAEEIDDLIYVSNDGTFTWKITNFREKMMDAQSERQTSIYSPAFYSSAVGYKMRAQLYVNGDGNARGTHMSLFFVLMRGRNDSILKFPFHYKVTFCLYDQTSQLRHIIDSFRPDIKSCSFQRPRSEMNIASGIPDFFPLETIRQEDNPYVREDTMFIKMMVNFGDMPKALLPFALSLNPGLPSNIQQEIIQQEAERKARS